ncbi:MAG: hypothetical protein CM15mV18_0530 [uncultured marine virus]|nr:MAG: hypothetical protein CM15mV18_0530 [uncultured marine virus]
MVRTGDTMKPMASLGGDSVFPNRRYATTMFNVRTYKGAGHGTIKLWLLLTLKELLEIGQKAKSDKHSDYIQMKTLKVQYMV